MKKLYASKKTTYKIQKKFGTHFCQKVFICLFFSIFLLLGINAFANNEIKSNNITLAPITNFPAGVYIIDMGQATQTINNGLKPYGLVYALINAGIPVNWAINETKLKDGVDFNATTAATGNKAYKGGSFIIDVVTYPAALPIINSWKTANPGLVVDGPTTAAFNAPIYKTLTIWPNAFLDDQNDSRITPLYGNAGIPSSSYHINSDPTDLPTCGSSIGTQDIYILPHADPQDWDATFVSALQNFINNGGAMWAGCHAVSAIESIPGCNFLSSTGLVLWTDHNDPSPPYTYTDSGNPIMQFIGTMDNTTTNGSEQIYIPKTTWRNTTTVGVYDSNYVNTDPNPDVSYTFPTNPAAVVAYGPAYGNKGMIMYEAGHNLNNQGTTAEKVAAQRAFFNFLLLAGSQPQNSLSPPVVSNQTTTTCNGVAFSSKPLSDPITYTWTTPTGTGFIGGSAQNIPQSSISQTLTNTTINPVTATYIVTPRNGNCLGNPFTLTVTVYPPTNMAVTSTVSSVCLGDSTTLTASGAASYNWSPATGLNTTTGAVVIATPTVTTTYTVTEPGSTVYGCTNSKSITITVITGSIVAGATPNPICVGATLNLTSSIGIGNSSGVLISEGFNGATNNWTTTNNSTGGVPAEATWTLRPDDYKIDCSGDKTKLSSNDNSQFYLSNSCEQGSGGVTQTILQSPVMSTVGYTTLSMSFYHYFKFFTGASAKVEVSTNGTTWTTVANYNSATIGAGNAFALQNINLSAYVGNPVFYIRFKYDAPWSWYWAIDNVTISGTKNSPISWTGPNFFNSVVQNPSITNVTAANAGVYTLTYTDPAGCTATNTVNVSVNSLPTINVSASPASICIGGSTTITATGALTYSWTPGTGLSATAGDIVTADPTTTTTYTITGTDANGCSNVGEIEINVASLPTISITPSSALICTSIGTPLTASGAATYSWSPSTGLSAATGTTVTASPSSATTYTVTGTTINGCVNTETVFVDVIPSPPTTGVTICPGGTGSLTSSAICPPGNSTTVGPSNAGTGTNLTAGAGTLAWTNPGNAISSNGTFATVAINGPGLQSSQYLRTTNYGFNIPLNATITGIAVTIGRYSSDVKAGTDIKDLEVNLLKAGAIFGSNYADTSIEWPKGPSVSAKNYGGNIDTWGVTWTPTEINDTNFGVSLRANSDNDRTASVDYMTISVTYTIPGVLNWFTTVSGGTSIGTGSPFNPVGVANSGLVDTNTPGTYTFYAECSSDTRCRTATTFVITPNVGTPVFSLGTSSSRCQAANSVTYTASATNSTGITYTLDALSLAGGNTIVAGTGVVSFVAGWTGTSIVTATATGCDGPKSATHTITTNLTPTAPIIGTITQTNCSIATGSVVLSGLQAGGILNPGNISYSGTSHTVLGLNPGSYAFTITSGNCTSPASANVVINPILDNIWNGTNWSLGYAPTSGTERIIFNANYTANIDLKGCSCLVNGTAAVTINSGNNLTLTNELTVNAAASMTFNNNASLIQINNNAINIGNIKMIRTSRPMRRWSYVYAGSPIVENAFGQIPSQFDLKYKWISGTMNGSWAPLTALSSGEGYIARVRNIAPFNTGTGTINFEYTGTPKNGIVDVNVDSYDSSSLVSGNTALLANPYPSAIDAKKFLEYNVAGKSNIELGGTLFFWTSVTLYSGSGPYDIADYGSWNLVGGVGTGYTPINAPSDLSLKPNGKIAAGQGFVAQIFADGQIHFDNIMRESGFNDQFFKNSITSQNTDEKNRIWLNLYNNNTFKQMLIGYVDGATDGEDRLYDGDSFTNNEINIYSLLNNRKLVIQGKSLPFNVNDEVPIGYKITNPGIYSIAIDELDGIFSGSQNIYLKDNLLNITHDLKASPYQFTSSAGMINDRFKIVYINAALGNPDYSLENNIKVIANNEVAVNSSNLVMESIIVYNILGQKIITYKDINSSYFSLSGLHKNNTTLLLKIKLQSGESVVKKVIY